jgi:hypothetical protein
MSSDPLARPGRHPSSTPVHMALAAARVAGAGPSLLDLSRGGGVLLIFLRHFG